ncbi:MAG: CpsD/CapB family tyrosine-protein kinase, partial [Acidimicrobiales bacterium]
MPSTFLAPRWSDPGSYEESLRLLRTNLEAALEGTDHAVVLFTSAQPLRDRTGVSAALGISFALAGREVLVIDADLRAPRAHVHLHGDNSRGLADALAGSMAPEDAIQDVPAPEGVRALGGLQLMAGGSPVSNPTDLISGKRMADLLESVSLQVDLVLVDAPPVLSRADAL